MTLPAALKLYTTPSGPGEEYLLAPEKLVHGNPKQTLWTQRILASEGVWVEPASAAGLAGLIAESAVGKFDAKGKKVVVVCTGHGMKDPSIITESFQSPKIISANYESLIQVVGV